MPSPTRTSRRPLVSPRDRGSHDGSSYWRRPASVGLLVSFLLHALLCLTLGLCVWHAVPRGDAAALIETVIASPSPREAPFELASDEEAGSESQYTIEAPTIPPTAFALTSQTDPEISPLGLPPAIGSVSGHGLGRGGSGGGTGTGNRKPPGKNAVREGSFTVWTEPDDPLPGENYLILIEVKLPEKVSRYPRSDISGLVTGTDGWRQPLPGTATPLQSYLPVEEHTVQLQVEVPGGGRRVEDIVKVRSRLLKEEQVLKIVF